MVGLTCSSSLFRTRNHALCTATHSHHRPHPSLHGESGGERPRCRLCPQVLTLVHAPLTAVVVDVVLAIIRSRDQPLHIHQINGTATQKQWTSPRNRTREERRSPSPLQEAAKLVWIGDAGIDVLSWPLRVGPSTSALAFMPFPASNSGGGGIIVDELPSVSDKDDEPTPPPVDLVCMVLTLGPTIIFLLGCGAS